MKFSIIIPIYNVEKYLEKCLKSIQEQTYDNFEVILVNDGSPDNSKRIIKKFEDEDNRFKGYLKENGGLSDARNYGLNYVKGDYILFVDSDDYIEKDLLFNLTKNIKNSDVIKFRIKLVDEEGNQIREEKALKREGEIEFDELTKVEFFEPAWSYAYKTDFFLKENFKYPVGKIHEDFGLTPLCVLKASKISYINYIGYNYVQRSGSIMNGASKAKKRAEDMLYHYDYFIKAIDGMKNKNIKIFKSFISNGILNIGSILNKQDLKWYIKEIKKRKVYNDLVEDTITRKFKKFIVKNYPALYIKYFI